MESETKGKSSERLWVGNLDHRLTEYQIIKFLQKCGNIEKFDLLYFRDGPKRGYHRGFAFVTYKNNHDTESALKLLNEKVIMGRRISVKYANKLTEEEINAKQPDLKISALTGASNTNKIGTETAIRAIESKLKLMENQSLDVEAAFNKSVSQEVSLVKRYQYNLDNPKSTTQENKSKFDHKYRGNRWPKPYAKKKY